MKHILLVATLTVALSATLHAQHDVEAGLNKVPIGYEYMNIPFPPEMLVFKMDKSKHILKAEGVTLIQVWTMRDGARPELWNRVRDIENTYKGVGLTTISINFENGTDFKRQQASLAEFFKSVTQPENFYFDSMGYVADLLAVSGFPLYYLVDKQGTVIFKTKGEDMEGVDLLESQIKTLLKAGKGMGN